MTQHTLSEQLSRVDEQVLVLDADTLPALAIVRSLGRAGASVICASHEAKPISARSRYSSLVLCYPSPLAQPTEFLLWLEQILNTRPNIGMVIPVTERTLVPISKHFDTPALRARFAIAEHNALEQVLDKSLTANLAERCQVPQPASWTLHQPEDLSTIVPELTFPVVIKPGRSITQGNTQDSTRQSMNVCYAHSPQELINLCQSMLSSTHLILQEYFSGEGIGIELLAAQGEIVYAFQHRRLHEVPLSGGGSSLRVSEEPIPELLTASKQLIRELQWQGVAMVEFKWQPLTRRFILIEINGRFWGSLPLATAAGADFPQLLWHQHYQRPIPVLPAFKRNLRCRKLSADLAWFEAVMRRDADPRLVTLPSRAQAVHALLTMLLPGQRFDAQSLSDPLPGLIDMASIMRTYWQRLTGIISDKLRSLLYRRRSRWQQVSQIVGKSQRILFICYGNINRSALADVLFQHYRPATSTVECRSAGFHREAGRNADPRMVALAAKQGVDMGAFRSHQLDTELLQWADLILVMETSHIEQLKNDKRVYLMGGLIDKAGLAREIPDPYNQAGSVYQTVYQQVESAIKALLKLS
ncbi:MAG: ATP-grasp domain-containing protein [Parahaliea sp.]